MRNFLGGGVNNIWQIKKEHNENIKAGFPEKLVFQIIENFTKKNDLIIDPFMGSGTTGIVAKKTDRQFIGIEIDPAMYEIAKKRINNTFYQNAFDF